MPGTKIVLVTAEAALARITSAHLEDAGFKVILAKGLTDAVKRVREEAPHLVLVDSAIEGGGERLLANLRRAPGLREVPVAVWSLRAEASDRLSALKAGANFFLDRSIEPGDLVRRVRRIMGDRLDNGPELRVLPRLTITVPVQIKRLRGREAKPVAGQIRDLSGAGISFYSAGAFEKREMLELDFILSGEKPERTFMEVVWRRAQGDGFLIGCKYLPEHPGDVQDVMEFVRGKKR